MKAKKGKKSKLNGRRLGIKVVVGIGILGLLFYFKNLFIVGWVNRRPIFRISYSKEVNRLAGQRALDTLITKRLILQEAKKRQLTVSDDELNQEMQSIEAIAQQQNMDLDQLLALQNLDRNTLTEEIRIQKLLEKMIGDVSVTQEEIQAYWDDNQSFYPDQTLADVSDQIASQLKQQKLSDAAQQFITNLQNQANVVSWL